LEMKVKTRERRGGGTKEEGEKKKKTRGRFRTSQEEGNACERKKQRSKKKERKSELSSAAPGTKMKKRCEKRKGGGQGGETKTVLWEEMETTYRKKELTTQGRTAAHPTYRLGRVEREGGLSEKNRRYQPDGKLLCRSSCDQEKVSNPDFLRRQQKKIWVEKCSLGNREGKRGGDVTEG